MREGLVFPCYNESERFSVSELERLLQLVPGLSILLVNDGSTDATKELLESLSQKYPRVSAMNLEHNQGKAEAVRRGMLELMRQNIAWVGYADADFATPATEIARLWQVASEGQAKVVLGSRVRLLGRDIQRRSSRHYLGRIFATFSSLALRLPVYDTQCGAKLFQSNEALQRALAQPFKTRWIFDVELLGRLICEMESKTGKDFVEVPLMQWRDVAGSKLKAASMLRAAFDLLLVARQLRHRRRMRQKRMFPS